MESTVRASERQMDCLSCGWTKVWLVPEQAIRHADNCKTMKHRSASRQQPIFNVVIKFMLQVMQRLAYTIFMFIHCFTLFRSHCFSNPHSVVSGGGDLSLLFLNVLAFFSIINIFSPSSWLQRIKINMRRIYKISPKMWSWREFLF